MMPPPFDLHSLPHSFIIAEVKNVLCEYERCKQIKVFLFFLLVLVVALLTYLPCPCVAPTKAIRILFFSITTMNNPTNP